jgi:hypothetical protein
LQAKERGAASAGASSVMIKSNFTRSEFVVLSSDHSKSPALSPLLCIKYREKIVAGVPQRKQAQLWLVMSSFIKLPQHAVVFDTQQVNPDVNINYFPNPNS